MSFVIGHWRESEEISETELVLPEAYSEIGFSSSCRKRERKKRTLPVVLVVVVVGKGTC